MSNNNSKEVFDKNYFRSMILATALNVLTTQEHISRVKVVEVYSIGIYSGRK